MRQLSCAWVLVFAGVHGREPTRDGSGGCHAMIAGVMRVVGGVHAA